MLVTLASVYCWDQKPQVLGSGLSPLSEQPHQPHSVRAPAPPQHRGTAGAQVTSGLASFPLLDKRFSFLRIGKCPANQRSGSRQGLHAFQGPGAGHQAALAGPGHPGVLRQEEGVPAVRLCQIVSTGPRGAARGSQAGMLPVLQSSFSVPPSRLSVPPHFMASSHLLKPSFPPQIPDFSPCLYLPFPTMSQASVLFSEAKSNVGFPWWN